MKKFISIIFAVIMAFSFSLFGCNSNKNEQTETAEYTIMYNDGTANHTLKVKSGDVYEIEQPLPSKTGYDFLGLYDAEVGGTQYVSYTGISIIPFNENTNMVLYPHFKAKTYNLVLNYGEAKSPGIAFVSVDYDEILPSLPGSITISDKSYLNFCGWYTQDNCNGIKICDSYGISALRFGEELEQLCNSQGNLQLYAGFTTQTCKITFYDEKGSNVLAIKELEYGSLLSENMPDISVDGNKVVEWSNTRNGTVFRGVVTQDMYLYAVGYDLNVKYTRENCELDNGYDPFTSGTIEDISTHAGYDLFTLTLSGCIKNESGKFIIPDKGDITLNLKMLEDPTDLPRNANIGVLWAKSCLNADNYSGIVYGINGSNNAIGYGAYYLNIVYADGTEAMYKQTDFMNGLKKDSIYNLNFNINMDKKLSRIDIVIIYEFEYSYYTTNMRVYKDYSNWRCAATLQFV